MFLYGYRMNEVPRIELPENVKETLKVGKSRKKKREYNNERPCLSTNLPLCFVGATPPRPDYTHPPSTIGGVGKRFGFKPPAVSRKFKRRFTRFVDLWLKRNLTPLTKADTPSFEAWLSNTSYTESRKAQLLQVWNDCGRKLSLREARKVKSFIKDETYPEYKYPRLINSRIDAAKCYFGPVVDAISSQLMSQPWFIKYIPVSQRPEVLRDTLLQDGQDYIFTDYTSFEAHFTPEVMDMVQFRLFRHMYAKVDHAWYVKYKCVMAGRQCLQFKDVNVELMGTRMSGEMDTSLSNGFCNLMTFLFVASELNGATDVVGFVEGDDGLFRVTPKRSAPTKEQFADLGFTIKIGVTNELSEASFCGQVYDMEDLIVVTDPKEVIARVGFTNKQYVGAREHTRMQLLRAKGYSLVYQYRGCPCLQALGLRILELTAGTIINPKVLSQMDQWEKDKMMHALSTPIQPIEPGRNTRSLVERLYGVTVEQQLRFESMVSKLKFGLHPVPFASQMDPSWHSYYQNYSSTIRHADPCWLVCPENKYLDMLAKFQNLSSFVESVR